MEREGRRDLDITKSTTDVASLNNFVVSMRKAVKGAKILTLNKLTRSLKSMKKKKGKEEQQKKMENKMEKLSKEMEFIKHVKPDKVSKFALAKMETFEEICRKHPDSIEKRALARLSENKFVVEKVKSFRDSHEDWKELAAFILSKNTGRRFKQTKGTGVQREVEEVLLQSQQELQKREKRDESSSESEKSDSETDAEEESSSDNEENISAESKSESVVDEAELNSDKSHNEKTVKQKSKSTHDTDMKNDSHDEETELLSTDKDSQKIDNEYRKEIIIKKLNLDHFKDGNIIVEDDVPSFLLSQSTDECVSKIKKKSKSKFFMNDSESEDESGDGQSGDEQNDGEDEDLDRKNEEIQEKNKLRAREAIDSTFLGSLSSAGRRQLEKRDNRRLSDFKRKRQEKSQNWQTHQRVPLRKPTTEVRAPYKGQNMADKQSKSSKGNQTKVNSSSDSAIPDKELHPSWEASRKRKQQQSQIQPFQGKKIKFDDD